MPSYLEFEEKNIERAAQKASKKLNIPIESLTYDVISYGSSGIFGLVGTKKAKIRVSVSEKTPRPPAPASQQPSPPEDLPIEPDPAVTLVPEADYEEAVTLGENMLQRMVDEIATDATIRIERNPGRVLFNIQNDNPAILIGKRGQTLEAMQYLVEKTVNRQNKTRIRVQVDVGGYLENRKNHLKQLAERMAQKAKKTNKPVTVGQMNAYDRRIVHLALKNEPAVRTQSLGDGFYRKLVIFPKKPASKNNS